MLFSTFIELAVALSDDIASRDLDTDAARTHIENVLLGQTVIDDQPEFDLSTRNFAEARDGLLSLV